jgi:molybdenum cofactor synthesis domain-containing protein|tara:strand:- start:60 stop:833 length:774 start_codon:yes stop_codon:yes gene_type:complete
MVSTAGIIIIGDEILSGRTKDTNINWIATELNNIGVRLIEARIISDDSETIIETVKNFTKKFTYVFSCGGIGPTHDDITTESVAKAFDQKLVKDPEAMRRLKLHYEGTNIEFNEARQKMAIIPTNSSLIDNPVSAAPGFKIENLFVFAGVPKIMQGMFNTILNDLIGGVKLKSKTVSSNIGEGLIAKDLERIEKKFKNVKIGSYPYFKPGNFGTSIVLRSESEILLNQASETVLSTIIKLGGEGKIVHENEVDERSF